MEILVSSHYSSPTHNVTFVDKDYLYKNCDFLSLHCMLNDTTQNMINADVLNLLKPTCYLINTARAALVNKQDLMNALKNKIIAGAAIDGFWNEPPQHNDPLFSLENTIITPHV